MKRQMFWVPGAIALHLGTVFLGLGATAEARADDAHPSSVVGTWQTAKALMNALAGEGRNRLTLGADGHYTLRVRPADPSDHHTYEEDGTWRLEAGKLVRQQTDFAKVTSHGSEGQRTEVGPLAVPYSLSADGRQLTLGDVVLTRVQPGHPARLAGTWVAPRAALFSFSGEGAHTLRLTPGGTWSLAVRPKSHKDHAIAHEFGNWNADEQVLNLQAVSFSLNSAKPQPVPADKSGWTGADYQLSRDGQHLRYLGVAWTRAGQSPAHRRARR